MKKLIASVVILGSLFFCAAVFYLTRQEPEPLAQTWEPAETPNPPSAQAEPAIRYPVPENQDSQLASKPLPSLQDSDQSVSDALSGLLGRQSLKKIFRLDDIVRNIVVTVDNMPRQTMAMRQLPVKPADGIFLTEGTGNSLSISAKNAERYAPYIRIAEMVDAKKLVAVYVHFYPLFQRAYQELGYPQGYFNDRLIQVIDHLLDAPQVEGAIMLVQPHVLYRFEDSDLEADSAGHKIMVRMGSENAAKVKAKLREIRRQLTGAVPQN
jgi:hypothetical protein